MLFDGTERINLRPQHTADRLRVSGICAVPAHDGATERRLRPARDRIAARESGAPRSHERDSSSDSDLTAFTARYPSELSGGQQQRVALARALAHRSRRAAARRTAIGARRAAPPGVVRGSQPDASRLGQARRLVTHDLSEAYQIADTVVLYEHGATTGAMSKNDLLWNPSSERVARLIGARNILSAPIAEITGDSIALDLARHTARSGTIAQPSAAGTDRRSDCVLGTSRVRAADSEERDRSPKDSGRRISCMAKSSTSATKARPGCSSSGWTGPEHRARERTISKSKFRSSSTSVSASRPIASGTYRFTRVQFRYFHIDDCHSCRFLSGVILAGIQERGTDDPASSSS